MQIANGYATNEECLFMNAEFAHCVPDFCGTVCHTASLSEN